MRTLFLMFVLCLVATVLAGCGQKGPLVPRASSTAPASTVAPPSIVPASGGSSVAPGADSY